MVNDVLSHFHNYPLLSALAHSAKQQYIRYDNTQRHYHNYEHALQVADTVISLGGKYETVLAAVYHDVVYFPGAGGDYNEVISGMSLGVVAHDLSCMIQDYDHSEKQLVNKAQELIEHTSLQHHLEVFHDNTELKILLDADLSPLAIGYTYFVYNQKKIILENRGNPESKEDQKKSAEFLMHLLKSRKSIFRTERGIDNFEQSARENIKMWYNETLK